MTARPERRESKGPGGCMNRRTTSDCGPGGRLVDTTQDVWQIQEGRAQSSRKAQEPGASCALAVMTKMP